ncbi:MAG TPA: hypothetical protein VGD66_14250 [Allosphingosinicella sp.]|jgi:hypothetical protein
MSARRRLARALVRRCAALLPPGRSVWAAAMEAELDAVEPRAALGFAAGCVWGSVRERWRVMDRLMASVRLGSLVVLFGLAGAGTLSALRLGAADPATGLVFGLSSAAYGAVGLWSLALGPRALVRAAAALAPACAAAFLLLRFAPPALPEGTDLGLWRALTLEAAVIWAALLAAGTLLMRLAGPSGQPPGSG